MKFKTRAELDAFLLAIGGIARTEVAKALIPLQNKVSALEVENMALKDAIKQMREQQALAAMTPTAFADRYRSLS